MPVKPQYLDQDPSVTPPNGYLQAQPFTLGPTWQTNDVRVLFVSGSESASGGVSEAIQMNPDPPTGYTAAYTLNTGFETRGVYYRRLVTGDTDGSVAWIKPTSWRDFVWMPLTIRGVHPTVAPVGGDITGQMSHNVQDTSISISSITVPAAGEMLVCVWTIPDPEGNWPSWATALGEPSGWKTVSATDKSGTTYNANNADNDPSLLVFGKSFAAAGSTGTITVPCNPGSHAFGGMYLFIQPAPDVSTTIGAVTETDSLTSITSSATTLVSAAIGAVSETDSPGQIFTGTSGFGTSPPLPLSGRPVTGSVVEWATTAGRAGATIAPAGPLYAANGTALATLSVTTVNVGDVILLTTAVGSNTITATGVSGGNATGWTRVCPVVNDATIVVNVDMWMGVVTSAGTANITVTYSASIAGRPCYYDAKQFTAGAGVTWAVDNAGGADHATSLSLAYPALAPTSTPSGFSELYYGLAWSQQTGTVAGSTTGFSYARDAIGRLAAWNTTVSGPVAPTASQTVTGPYISQAVLLTATTNLGAQYGGDPYVVKTSINGGASWDTATNGGPVPRLNPDDTATRSVLMRISTARNLATDVSPQLSYLRLAVTDDASTVEMVPVGHGVVDKVTRKRTTTNSSGGPGGGPGVVGRGGGQAGGGKSLTVHAVDLSKAVSANPWQSGFVIQTGENYVDAAVRFLLNRLPSQSEFRLCTTTKTTPEPFIYGLGQGTDPWKDLKEFLLPAGLECFFDAAGVFVIRQIPDPAVGVPVWTIDDDAHPVITDLSDELSADQVFNYITVKGQGTSTKNAVSATAFDNNPLSLTYILGDFGTHSVTISLPGLETPDQAQIAANAILAGSLSGSQVITISMVPNPALEVGDLVRLDLEDEDTSGVFLINGMTWSPSQAEPMQLICARQTPAA